MKVIIYLKHPYKHTDSDTEINTLYCFIEDMETLERRLRSSVLVISAGHMANWETSYQYTEGILFKESKTGYRKHSAWGPKTPTFAIPLDNIANIEIITDT